MINQFDYKMKYLLKKDVDIINSNLVNGLDKEVFNLYYVEKLSKLQIRKKLKLGQEKLDNILEELTDKIILIPEMGLKFDVYTASKTRLVARCALLGKSDDYIRFCIYAYHDKLTKREIADKMCLDIDTVRKYRTDRRKELESF